MTTDAGYNNLNQKSTAWCMKIAALFMVNRYFTSPPRIARCSVLNLCQLFEFEFIFFECVSHLIESAPQFWIISNYYYRNGNCVNDLCLFLIEKNNKNVKHSFDIVHEICQQNRLTLDFLRTSFRYCANEITLNQSKGLRILLTLLQFVVQSSN